MPTPKEYVANIKDTAVLLSGSTAPTTGQYYSHIYSQDDPGTGVPTLGVELYNDQQQKGEFGKPVDLPLQLNNLTDAQILEMLQNGETVGQVTPTEVVIMEGRANAQANTTLEAQQNQSPIMGIFILVLLLLIVSFVYFIIRIWQDHKAQTKIMTSIQKKPTLPSTPITKEESQPQSVTQANTSDLQWRTKIERAEAKLQDLLSSKGIPGETISDKLKVVKPGQFALADLAWEAQQGAKTLLTAHDSDASEQSIKRTLQLFKQVFAEHGV